ncbi:MAG: DUF3325 domain-containing protein [Methylobacterium sp.]|uniref:DUF3325 domain-containing protein n=1 Tax=Methylobacterium sp. TaxID=409 RepID=UPI0025D5D254|nr:DUF3325 domain-containing protein [Methylobacterium sp.]MBX9930824.1 DUF3325 domain-containing protein [Methylobacterium sp.]
MTPIVLLLTIGLSYVGLAALCLGMNRHHSAIFEARPDPRRALLLRSAGWIAIGLSFASAVHFEGWAFGPVQWIGGLTAAALLVVGILSYRPGLILPTAALVLPVALAAAISI